MCHARNTLGTTLTVLAVLALAGCDGGGDTDPSGSAGTPVTASAPPGDGPSPGPRSMEGVNGALEPGPWAVPLFAARPHRLPRAVVDVPPGYGSPGGWVVDRGADGDPEEYGDVAFWVVRDVARDPCHGTEFVRPAAGVRPLVDALVAQPGQRASRPKPVRLDGHRGLYVELTQDGTDVRGCHTSEATLWHSTDDFTYGYGFTGTVLRCWVLDVDGLRVLTTALTTPHETPAEAAEVVAIARSVHFIDPLES